jgi:hypothetical protein
MLRSAQRTWKTAGLGPPRGPELGLLHVVAHDEASVMASADGMSNGSGVAYNPLVKGAPVHVRVSFTT